jgi:hypothetical protein
MAIRVYSASPHAHLLEYGHRIVDKNKVEHGFKEGAHFFEAAEKSFTPTFFTDCEAFVDGLLDKHKL